MIYIYKLKYTIIMKNNSIISIDKTYKDIKSKHKYQILDVYWKKRKKEYEKNLSKFC